MSLAELLPALHALTREEKLRAMQVLLQDFADDEAGLFQSGRGYPAWSPYGAYSAGKALIAALEADAANDAVR